MRHEREDGAIVKAVALLAFALLACARPADHVQGDAGEPATTQAPASGESIYLLQTTLVDQDGAKVPLDVYRGHPVIIAMFYGTCPSACPTLTRKIKDIEASLSPEQRAKVRVLMISFDPERDTPAALSALAAKHHLDPARWKLTAATESGAREIAAILGVEYRKTEEGEFSHSAPITLLDGRGVVVTKMESPADSTDELLRKLRSAE